MLIDRLALVAVGYLAIAYLMIKVFDAIWDAITGNRRR
jgi:Na+/melibiose symporter-like transporter